MAYSQASLFRVFAAIESTYGTAVGLSAADAFRCIEASITGDVERTVRLDQDGSNDTNGLLEGDISGGWSASFTPAGSGVAGTVPDASPILQAAFGAVATGSTVDYTCSDDQSSFTMLVQDAPSTIDQSLAIGAFVERLVVTIGSDGNTTIEASGACMSGISKEQFASLPTAAKGGLGAFPSYISSYTVAGVPPRKRTGVITLGGNTHGTLRSARLTYEFGRRAARPDWNAIVTSGPEQASKRLFTAEFELTDSDSAARASLAAAAAAGTSTNLSFGVGTVAGNTWAFLLNNCKLAIPRVTRGEARRGVAFTATAQSSSPTALDAGRITIS